MRLVSPRSRRVEDRRVGLVAFDELDLLPLPSFVGEVEVVDACWSNCVEVGAPGIRRMFDRLDMAAADLEGNVDARLAIRDVVRDYRAGVSTLEQAHIIVRSVLSESKT